MKKIIVLFGLFVILIVLSACGRQLQKSVGSGFLTGKIEISPLCPVQRIPPDPRCQPNQETFNSWPIAVYSADKSREIARLQPDSQGIYRIELPVGSYVVDFENKTLTGHANLPFQLVVNLGETTEFNINIDTGIR